MKFGEDLSSSPSREEEKSDDLEPPTLDIPENDDDSEDFSVEMITSSVQQLALEAEKENVVEKHQLQKSSSVVL